MVYSKPPRFCAWSTPSSSGWWRPPLATCARQQRRQLFWNWCHRRQSVYRSASLSWKGRVASTHSAERGYGTGPGRTEPGPVGGMLKRFRDLGLAPCCRPPWGSEEERRGGKEGGSRRAADHV